MPLDLPSDIESASLEFSLDARQGQQRPSLLMGLPRPDLLRDEILADLLEATARQMPDKTALIDGMQSLTYAELDDAASLAASRLIEAGVGPGQRPLRHAVVRGAAAVRARAGSSRHQNWK